MRNLYILAVLLTLSACGGGSGSSVSPAPVVAPPSSLPNITPYKSTAGQYKLFTAQEIDMGDSVSIALTKDSSLSFNALTWQQISGPTVDFLAGHTQVIGFDVPTSGDYEFRFSATATNGQTLTDSVSFSVSAQPTNKANIRVDHAVSEKANVSLRIDGDNTKTAVEWQWRQVRGSVAVSIDAQDAYAYFDAPEVNNDEIVEIEGTITYQDGTSSTDAAFVVIKNVTIDKDGYFPRYSDKVVTTDAFVYRPSSPYAAALRDCVYNNLVKASCTFQRLPLIGMINEDPSIDDIMNRLVVSHEWMGQRFEDFLRNSITASDMRKLLRATTAIVISYDVRPSFYWTATGAIYLDAANFWSTPQERDTLNTLPDYRSEFGSQLQFLIPWRYIKDNEYYIRNADYPRAERLTKSFSAMEASVTWLMYHELGHANDFFPPNRWSSINRSQSPLSYANSVDANSTQFANIYPLTSETMRNLAQVSFMGETPTALQKSYTAQQVGQFFSPDSAPAYYSYSTIREDYATLFERFMMLYRLGVSADVAVVEADDLLTYPVAFGQRDRIKEADIQQRVIAVVEQVFPDIDAAQIYPTLPNGILFEPGESYFDQVQLGQGQKEDKASQLRKSPNRRLSELDFIQYHQGRPITPKTQ